MGTRNWAHLPPFKAGAYARTIKTRPPGMVGPDQLVRVISLLDLMGCHQVRTADQQMCHVVLEDLEPVSEEEAALLTLADW